MSGRIDIERLHLSLGHGAAAFEALNDVSLSVEPGEFVCVLGPSGCGKSTLLGALAGHLKPTLGQVKVDGEPIVGPHPERGLVFQQHTLLPWKRVVDNVAFGLKMRGQKRSQSLAEARQILARVGLAGFEARYPAELSGGMQQRVELARVLVNSPRVLLMDEPFSALDAQTRLSMQELLLELWQERRTSVLFITHDIDEALFLADRILVMSPRPGRIVEEIRVDFARPRLAELTAEPRFAELKRHCLTLLRDPEHQPPLPRLSPIGVPALQPVHIAV